MQQKEEDPLVKKKQNVIEAFGEDKQIFEFKAAPSKKYCRSTVIAKHLCSLHSVADGF